MNTINHDHEYLQEPSVRVLAAAATAAAEHDAADAIGKLSRMLQARLASMPPSDFDRMLGMCVNIAQQPRTGRSLVDILDGTLVPICPVPALGLPGELNAVLVAIPFVLDDPTAAWPRHLAQLSQKHLTSCLQLHGLLDEDVDITFLPVALKLAEVACLGYGEVHACARLLASGSVDEAVNLLERNSAKLPLFGEVGEADQTAFETGIGTLVAVVRSHEWEPFPLAAELRYELAHPTEQPSGDVVRGESRASQSRLDLAERHDRMVQAQEDTLYVLCEAAQGIAQALRVARLTLLLPPQDWYSSLEVACKHERNARLPSASRAHVRRGASALGLLAVAAAQEPYMKEGRN